MADGPELKKRKLEEVNGQENNTGGKMKIVLALCGSFNPPTFLHLRLFELARDFLHSQGKYSVIGGIMSPVHVAYGKKGLLSNEHRVSMCRLATQSSNWISLSDWECRQDGWTETEKVLCSLQEEATAKFPKDKPKLMFLCGGDLLESFATPGLWTTEDIRSIVCNYGLVVKSRVGSNPEKFIYESDDLFQIKEYIHMVTEWIPNDVSSTKIRRSLKRGESIRYLVPDVVIEFINEHHLYQEEDV